jgi:2-hydroxy-3-oxopropionate reductase
MSVQDIGGIGFVGLGVMGGPMAAHVAEAFAGRLLVFDIEPSRLERFPLASRARDLADLASRSDIVVLSLPHSRAVEEVVCGSGGLLAALRPASAVVDMSTTDPPLTQKIAAALSRLGIGFLDAPVSGGPKGAIEKSLSIMAGGDERTFERCLPVLRAMGSSVVHMGGTGLGGVAKLVNNLIVGAAFASIAEGFALGAKSGLDPRALYEAIRGGWAGSKVLDVAAAAMLTGDYRPGGTVNIHWKDLGYALSLAKEHDVPLPVTAIVHEIFKAARASGAGPLSQPAIVGMWEKLLGIDLRDAGGTGGM